MPDPVQIADLEPAAPTATSSIPHQAVAGTRAERATPRQVVETGATATPTAGAVPKAGVGATTLARGWIPEDWYNVRAYGAVGDNVTNDAVAIDAAVAAALASRGGVLYFPAGRYIYNGAGIVLNPAAGEDKHLVIMGDGPRASHINFTLITNPHCIRLGNQNAVGSGLNFGSGVRDISLALTAGSPGILIENLEKFLIDNVITLGGTVPLTISESRLGTVRSLYCTQSTVGGIAIVGETFEANIFWDVTLVSGSASGSAFDFTKTTATSIDGMVLHNVSVTGTWAGAAFNFTAATVHQGFMFFETCVADGFFAAGALVMKNLNITLISNSWFINHGVTGDAVVFDNANDVIIVGGQIYTDSGGGAADISLKNSCNAFAVVGTQLHGPNLTLKVDGTTHTNVDFRPTQARGATLCNDLTKIFAGANTRLLQTPPTFLVDPAGGKAGAFGILNNASGGLGKYLRVNSAGALEAYNDALTAALLTLADNGNLGLLGAGSFGTGAVGVLALKNATAPPTTSPADTLQLWVADTTAGEANLFARNEAGLTERLTGLTKLRSTTFTKSADTTLESLLVHQVAPGNFGFEAFLPYDADAVGGHKWAISGTATVSSIIYDIESRTNSGTFVITARHTALAGTTGEASSTAGVTRITGFVGVTIAGTIAVQFAQNAASGSSSVLAGSWFRLYPTGV